MSKQITDHPSGFQIGDIVEYTNDYGVKFSPRTITGFATEADTLLSGANIYINSDSPWMPVKADNLKKMGAQS